LRTNFADWCTNELVLPNLHELQKLFTTKFTNRLIEKRKRLLSLIYQRLLMFVMFFTINGFINV